MIKEMTEMMRVIVIKIEELHTGFKDLNERFEKYENNYRATQSNKIDINKYIKDNLGDSYDEKEVTKVKQRVLLMFDANQWQDIPAHELLGKRGMAIVDDCILSVIKFRTKKQVTLFDSRNENLDVSAIEIDTAPNYPTL